MDYLTHAHGITIEMFIDTGAVDQASTLLYTGIRSIGQGSTITLSRASAQMDVKFIKIASAKGVLTYSSF
jgi:hypothetical protein